MNMNMSSGKLRVGNGQEVLAWCSRWGRKESDVTEWLDWTELNWTDDPNESVVIRSFDNTNILRLNKLKHEKRRKALNAEFREKYIQFLLLIQNFRRQN